MIPKKKSSIKNTINFVIVVLIVLLTGCAHKLEIKNLNQYQNMSLNTLAKPVKIGIVTSLNDINHNKLIKGIATELGRYSARVILPYYKSGSNPVDIIATISIDSEYKGSGWNFLINWPGFLIFTPAWHGYHYTVFNNVRVLLTKSSDNQKIDSFNIPLEFKIRHADIGRTWTEISYLEVSAIAFIGGLVFIQYDDDITPMVAAKIQYPIGQYIAEEIISRINSYGEIDSEHSKRY